MKTNLPVGFLILLFCILTVISCKKSTETPPEGVNATSGVSLHDSTMTAVNTTVHPYPVTPVLRIVFIRRIMVIRSYIRNLHLVIPIYIQRIPRACRVPICPGQLD